MRKGQVTGNLALAGLDAIFQPTVSLPTAINTSGEYITELPLNELHPPEFHPFQIRDDEAMTRLVNSVKQYGVREPGLVRPREDNSYELIAGNRRKRACEIAGIETMPVIIREMDDDEAAIIMVDSNLEQRELLYSERAWAYRVKMDALNHRGRKSDNPGELSVEILCEQTGEKKNTIYRLISLTELVPALLDRVDIGAVKFGPAVELSNLSRTEQTTVADCLEQYDMRPSLSQAKKLRKESKDGKLTIYLIESILTEPKKDVNKGKASLERFSGYFPADYTPNQMEKIIIRLLESWQKAQPDKAS